MLLIFFNIINETKKIKGIAKIVDIIIDIPDSSKKLIQSKIANYGHYQRATLLQFLQIDLIAQTIGLIGYADIISPHYWFIIAIILSLKKSQGTTGRV